MACAMSNTETELPNPKVKEFGELIHKALWPRFPGKSSAFLLATCKYVQSLQEIMKYNLSKPMEFRNITALD